MLANKLIMRNPEMWQCSNQKCQKKFIIEERVLDDEDETELKYKLFCPHCGGLENIKFQQDGDPDG